MALAQGTGDFSVVVLGSDFAVDAGAALLNPADREEWHDCLPDLSAPADGDDFSDLEDLQVVRVHGTDRAGRRIVRVVGRFFPVPHFCDISDPRYTGMLGSEFETGTGSSNQVLFPSSLPTLTWLQMAAPVIGGERLKRYVLHKLRTELPDGPFCILYMHSTVQSDDNNPGMSILRGVYEDLPHECKERLQVLYFLHPGLRSRLAIATLGRLFLSGGLYWKIKYVSRLEYLWGDIRKGEVEIPDFVIDHDKVLEHRPLTDYGIEPDPLHLADMPAVGYSLGRLL
uniref:CRAL-TRIO domain-containing protein n=1 Tax=Oryza brachyantha TaxID=4533 RepID=J3L7T5_ORYBR